jgi:hypothetical protein
MKPGPPRRPAASDTNKNKWHAVSIVPGDSPCEAVLQSSGKRFLAADAPRIPLSGCKWPARCRCTYRHHADRRVALRRIADRGMYGRSVVAERRKQQDRRRADD